MRGCFDAVLRRLDRLAVGKLEARLPVR
jgi:hypothetical protein